MSVERVLLIEPRGFCAGVQRAVDTVEEALENFGAPIYVKHEIVHNKTVCDDLRAKGAIFIEEISEVPEGSICIFSAHGIAPQIREQARARKLSTIDATCPLVSKIHIEVGRFAREGLEIIYIGHRNHPEAIGVMGIRPDITQIVETPEEVGSINVKDPSKLSYLTQTTLSVDECQGVIDALKKRFPQMRAPPSSDICYATTNRQGAVKKAVEQCDVVIVIGSRNSSNSNRLVDTAKQLGVDAYLIDSVSELKEEWVEGKKTLGISAGASAPEYLVQELAQHFKEKGAVVESMEAIKENMKFTMPYELNRPLSRSA
jgi:4-hydroxy-3-methylbut-2-enyl diphosphate reductase